MKDNLKIEKIIKDYYRMAPYYLRLGENLKEALEFYFKEKGVSIVSLDYRVKNVESFLKKIKRKKYRNPIEETEDLCGVRVVCFFQNDIKAIEKIIKQEFKIISSENKTKGNAPTQFGYRSNHFIVGIKDGWAKAPNFRGLKSLKIEIQIRTLMMHAWAEIEHKLAYKKELHIPDEFRRRFSLLSAKLEEADGQFEELSNDIISRNKKLRKKMTRNKAIDLSLTLNLDNLLLVLDYYLPRKNRSIANARDLLDELMIAGITIEDLITAAEENKKNLKIVKGIQGQVECFREYLKRL